VTLRREAAKTGRMPDALAITTAPAGDFDGDAEADITVQLAAWMRDAGEVREVPFWCARVPLRWRYFFDGGPLYSKRSPGSGGVVVGVRRRRLSRS